MKRRLEGKVAIITGSGGGIGRASALVLAAEGASVLVNDTGRRTGADADSVVAEIIATGGIAVANHSSATWDGAAEIVGRAIDAFGRIDILINNATAGAGPADLWSVPEEGWDLSHAVNLKGYFAMIREAAPYLCGQRSGAIVNMSSASGYGHPSMVAFSSAKEGVVGLTRTVAREIGRFGVRCNAIRPLGLGVSSSELDVATARWAKVTALTAGSPAIPMDKQNLNVKTYPQWKIAPMVAWLCTAAAGGINGRTFEVRGDEVALLAEPTHEAAVVHAGGWTLDALDAAAPELVAHLTDAFRLDGHPELQIFVPSERDS